MRRAASFGARRRAAAARAGDRRDRAHASPAALARRRHERVHRCGTAGAGVRSGDAVHGCRRAAEPQRTPSDADPIMTSMTRSCERDRRRARRRDSSSGSRARAPAGRGGRVAQALREGREARHRVHEHRGVKSSRSTRALDVLANGAPDESLPGAYPFTRGIHPTGYRGKLWTMRQFAGFGSARGHERALQVPARARADGPLDGVRFPDADGLRLRSSALGGRGREDRRRDLESRRHGDAVRRHPARPGLDVDDDQRPGGDPVLLLRRGRGEAGRADARSSAARCRTTS